MTNEGLMCFEYGDLDALKFGQSTIPELGENEVLIKVAACGINFPDLLMIENKYQVKPPLPYCPGGEVSGKIIKLGSKVQNLALNQRVFALCGWGGFADVVICDTSRVFELPPFIDFVSGACTMYNYSTALYALKQRASLLPNERVLVLGAGGGLGLAALELAKIMGAQVIAAASEAKLDTCKLKDPDYLLDYNDPDFKLKLKTLTNDIGGIDVIFDPVGGHWAEVAFRNLNRNGRYLSVGFASGQIPAIPFNLPLLKSSSIIGVFWGDFSRKEPGQYFQNIKWIIEKFEEGLIKPIISKKYLKKEAKNALLDLKNQNIIGKAVVIWDENLCLESGTNTLIDKSKKLQFEDLKEVKLRVGEVLGESDWFFISQKMINDFAYTTQDLQWIHINTEKASNTPFQSTIVHGWLTISLSPFLLNQIFEIKNIQMGINYGADKIRFLKPIPVGSEIKLEVTLMEAVEVANKGFKIRIGAKYFMKNSEKPVCVAEFISVNY